MSALKEICLKVYTVRKLFYVQLYGLLFPFYCSSVVLVLRPYLSLLVINMSCQSFTAS